MKILSLLTILIIMISCDSNDEYNSASDYKSPGPSGTDVVSSSTNHSGKEKETAKTKLLFPPEQSAEPKISLLLLLDKVQH